MRFSTHRILAFASILLLGSSPVWAAGSVVKVVREKAGWQLQVNGQPFFIKGVGVNEATGENGEDYLAMAHDMGANAVRTWGGATREYLDKAQAHGLMVDLGFWLNPIRAYSPESYQDAGHCAGLKQMILSYVREMKDHPALLSWNVGNEVFAYTPKEMERRAFGNFLEDLVREIHRLDPNHPVVYASSASRDVADLKKYVPSLDILGINSYSGFSVMLSQAAGQGLDRPVIATEFGPMGSWDSGNDANGEPFDASDTMKASNYEALWHQIEAARPRTLGGFAFVLGPQRNSDSLTWFNVNYGDLRRESYWRLYKLYTGQNPTNRCPEVGEFSVEGSTGISPGQRFRVRAVASDPEGDPLTYRYLITDIFSDPLIVEPPMFYPAKAQETGPGNALLQAPNNPGIYRVYVLVTDNHRNVAIANRSLHVLSR